VLFCKQHIPQKFFKNILVFSFVKSPTKLINKFKRDKGYKIWGSLPINLEGKKILKNGGSSKRRKLEV
jgi:hypothetical protein